MGPLFCLFFFLLLSVKWRQLTEPQEQTKQMGRSRVKSMYGAVYCVCVCVGGVMLDSDIGYWRSSWLRSGEREERPQPRGEESGTISALLYKKVQCVQIFGLVARPSTCGMWSNSRSSIRDHREQLTQQHSGSLADDNYGLSVGGLCRAAAT
jgi:hypothetical protein